MMTDQEFIDMIGCTPEQLSGKIDRAIENGLIDYVWRNKPNLVDAVTPLLQGGATMRHINSIIRTAERNTGKAMHPLTKLALQTYCKAIIREHKRGRK